MLPDGAMVVAEGREEDDEAESDALCPLRR
jgi:hypothetical protein